MGNKSSSGKRNRLEPSTNSFLFGANIFNTKRRWSESPLFVAVDANDSQRVRQLLKNGHNIDKKDINGLTALHLAALNGSEDCVELLIQFNPRLMCCSLRQTPLHFAALNGNKHIINSLIDYGSVINVKDAMGSTPLGCAVDVDNCEAVVTLLRRGAVLHPHICLSALQKGFTKTFQVLINFKPKIINSINLKDFCFTRVTVPGLKLLFFAGLPFDATFVSQLQPMEWSDFCLGGRIRLPPEHYDRNKDMMAFESFSQWLAQSDQPMSLKCLSRIAFRNSCDQKDLYSIFDELNIPKVIENYLLLNDVSN